MERWVGAEVIVMLEVVGKTCILREIGQHGILVEKDGEIVFHPWHRIHGIQLTWNKR